MKLMQILMLAIVLFSTACAHKHCKDCSPKEGEKKSCCADKSKCSGDACEMKKDKCCDSAKCEGKCPEGDCQKCADGKCDGKACELKKGSCGSDKCDCPKCAEGKCDGKSCDMKKSSKKKAAPAPVATPAKQ